MRFFTLLVTGASLLLASMAMSADPLVIRTPAVVTEIDGYAVKMLELALSYQDRPVKIQHTGAATNTQARNIEDVQTGHLDLLWAATEKNIESRLLPIRIPLLKGLLGHRIFLIHRDAQAQFNSINNLQDLKSVQFGLGSSWADTQILRAAGLTVVTTNKYENLFYMLDGGRFDAFPRGVQEPWGELTRHANLELAVEKRVMLVYKLPFYLFVSPSQKVLAQQIESGLNRAIADGRFDEVFFSEPSIRDALEKADVGNRVVIRIDNSELPSGTPVDRAELWLNIDELEEKLAAYKQ